MKQTITFIILLLLVQTSTAQKIHFTDSGNIWRESQGSSDYIGYINYTLGDDTTIAQEVYKKVETSQMYPHKLAVREDTSGKVYFFYDSVVVVMYDFSLQ